MSSSKPGDERYTPEHVLDVVRAFGRGVIDTDPCTTSDNPTQAHMYWTAADNGLAQPWIGLTFVNPPYSRGELAKWTSQCADRAVTGRARDERFDIIALIPSDLGSKAGAAAASSCDALCFVRGRLAFGSPQGLMTTGAKQPSILAYWGERAGRFRRVFGQLGVVWTR